MEGRKRAWLLGCVRASEYLAALQPDCSLNGARFQDLTPEVPFRW